MRLRRTLQPEVTQISDSPKLKKVQVKKHRVVQAIPDHLIKAISKMVHFLRDAYPSAVPLGLVREEISQGQVYEAIRTFGINNTELEKVDAQELEALFRGVACLNDIQDVARNAIESGRLPRGCRYLKDFIRVKAKTDLCINRMDEIEVPINGVIKTKYEIDFSFEVQLLLDIKRPDTGSSRILLFSKRGDIANRIEVDKSDLWRSRHDKGSSTAEVFYSMLKSTVIEGIVDKIVIPASLLAADTLGLDMYYGVYIPNGRQVEPNLRNAMGSVVKQRLNDDIEVYTQQRQNYNVELGSLVCRVTDKKEIMNHSIIKWLIWLGGCPNVPVKVIEEEVARSLGRATPTAAPRNPETTGELWELRLQQSNPRREEDVRRMFETYRMGSRPVFDADFADLERRVAAAARSIGTGREAFQNLSRAYSANGGSLRDIAEDVSYQFEQAFRSSLRGDEFNTPTPTPPDTEDEQ